MIKGVCERNDKRNKGVAWSEKVHDKDKGIIAQSAQHNRNVLINERIKGNRGASRVM